MTGKGSSGVCQRAWDPEAPGLVPYSYGGCRSRVRNVNDHHLQPSGSPLHTDLGLSCRAAAKISDGSQYYVLLIITDGVISDMTQTKEAIVSVSLRRKDWQGGVTAHTVKGLRFLFHVYPNNFTCQLQRCLLAGAQTLAFDSLGPSMMPDEPTKETWV